MDEEDIMLENGTIVILTVDIECECVSACECSSDLY